MPPSAASNGCPAVLVEFGLAADFEADGGTIGDVLFGLRMVGDKFAELGSQFQLLVSKCRGVDHGLASSKKRSR
jgi:hypothetical protein